MSQFTPPAPGSDIPPPPGAEIPPPAFDHVPPPAPESEQFEADVLKRRKKFSWRNFGGDGFLVSVAFHVLLVIAGLFYVVSKYVGPKAKPETEVFATGSGGGQNGDKAKSFEHKLKAKMNTPVKTPSRIVSKNSNAAVALPSTPTTSTASFASGLSAGGMSKGSGGGTGGGEGTGIGIGKGGGRNFVSLFGARGLNAPGLPGIFYDAKQKPDGTPTKYEAKDSVEEFVDQVLRPFVKGFDFSRLDGRFFKAPEQLVASQIFIPRQSADAAPKAYGVQDKVKASRWLAVYHGTVAAPKTGRFRFWGVGDDVMYVRFENKPALDAGYTMLTLKGSPNYRQGVDKPVLGVKETKQARQTTALMRAGPWINVEKGKSYPLDIVISELPGGVFSAWLLMEEADPASPLKGDGKLFLFRMSDEPLPDGMTDDSGVSPDMTGKGLIWMGKGAKAGPIR